MPCRSLFSVFDAEVFARFFESVTFIRERERQRAQVQKVTTKDVSFLRFPGCGTLRNQVEFVRSASSGEAFQRTFAVNMLDADARPEPIPVFAAVLGI